jgi:hypothetical protein
MKLELTRFLKTNAFTAGTLDVDGEILYTLELPWNENERSVSCIPHGLYEVTPHGWEEGSQVKFKNTYHIQDVLNRSDILIHVGNWTKDTYGCVLVGTGFQVDNKSVMITNSKQAMNKLRQSVGIGNFKINIKE